MKNYISLLAVCILTTFSINIAAQTAKFTIKVSGDDEYFNGLGWLSIDSTTIVFPEEEHVSKNGSETYIVSLPEGNHRIENTWGNYTILDTTVYFSDTTKIIDLQVNLVNDFYLYEFKEGFKKIFGRVNPIIGLRDDGTFLMKRLIHAPNISYFLLEKGTYRLKDDDLILRIREAETSMYKRVNISYNYYFTVKNDRIIDLDKYAMRIGKERSR